MLKKISKNKRGQEEMVGFGIILIILAVVFIVFLSFSLRKTNETGFESFEATAFLSSILEYTTNCSIYYPQDYASIQELIGRCSAGRECFSGEDSCEVLNQTLFEILETSWPVGPEYPKKGYSFTILEKGNPLINFSEGNITRNYKGATQELVEFDINFNIYI